MSNMIICTQLNCRPLKQWLGEGFCIIVRPTKFLSIIHGVQGTLFVPISVWGVTWTLWHIDDGF